MFLGGDLACMRPSSIWKPSPESWRKSNINMVYMCKYVTEVEYGKSIERLFIDKKTVLVEPSMLLLHSVNTRKIFDKVIMGK